MVKKKSGGYISLRDKDRQIVIKEDFQGLSFDDETKFPKGLGAEHPFDFIAIENLYKKYGVVAGIVNKDTDSIIGEFKIKLKNENAQAIIDSFIHDTNFHVVIREWIREGLLKGNGFIETDLDNGKVRILNANYMYVKRNKKGKVLGYNQWTKPFKKFNRESPELIKFKPHQIAHLLFNKIPNDPYGIGEIWPNERVIENLVLNEQDLQKLYTRKAGSPYHFKVGQPGTNVPTSVVDDVNAKLQYLTNRTEWVTDADIDIKVIEFGKLGERLTDGQMYFYRMLLAGTEMPEVMMGSGQLNEGIAKTQKEVYKLKIAAKRIIVASVIEEKIIRPLLQANNLDEQPEFIWELPSDEDTNNRINQIQMFLSSSTIISLPMRAALELELAALMDLTELENILVEPKDADELAQPEIPNSKINKEKETEENIQQPEVPGAKPAAKEQSKILIKEAGDMDIKEWVNIQEIEGFNYTDYLVKILEVLNVDNFTNLKAITEADIVNGLLSEREIDKLRIVLKDGFRKNYTIKEIENSIKTHVDLKDRKIGDKVIPVDARANNIARTETVRVANKGLVNLYKENKIEKVRWLSALSNRTCPDCEALNGQVFNIDTATMPPLHSMCRCSLLSVIE